MQRIFGLVGFVCLVAVAGCGDDGTHHLADAPDLIDTPPATAMLTIDRATASFGSVTLSQVSPPTTFTITNTGGDATGALATAIGGPDMASFAVGANTCTGTLAPAATCTVAVTFSPLAVGAKTATLSILGMPGGTAMAALDGDGVGIGALAISSTTSALGSVAVGQTGTTVATFTVTNTGTGASGSLSVIPGGSDPQDFAKSTDTCASQALAAGATCTFQVRISPLSAGVKAATFQVTGSPGGIVSGAVTGTGLAPAALRAVPLQLDFGSVVLAQPSAPLTLTIANTGGVATSALTLALTGDFAASGGTCNGATLGAGATCTVGVVFTPTAIGSRTGTVSVTGAPGGTAVTTLVGEGISASQLQITPSAQPFATTNVGQTSSAQLFTIKNNGAVATGALVASLGGNDPTQYKVIAGTDGCTGLALAAGGTCTISVAFAPTVGGFAQASLTVAGSPGGAVSAGLLGVGAAPAALAITPATRAFGSVVIGTMSPPQTFTVTNFGGQVSGVPAASLTGAAAAQFAIAGNTCTSALAPGASCSVQVRFNPAAAGAATAGLAVSGTPGGTVMGTLSGDGIAPGGLVIIPSFSTFPLTPVGVTAPTQTFTVWNTGLVTTTTVTALLTGTNAGDYIVTNGCATLAPNATCLFTVMFKPGATGDRTATLTASATTGGTASAALTGAGRAALEIIAINAGPVVDPANLGNAIINNPTPHDVQILVRNNTLQSKTFGITPSFGNPAQYSVVGATCGASIAGNGLCTVSVRFAPTSTGTKNASVTFDIGSGIENQAKQNLTGVGIDSLVITALAGTTFGSVPINTTPGALAFRVTNPAGSPTSGAIDTTIAGGASFTITDDDCDGQTLAAGASCLVKISFSPVAVAAAMTTLSATATPGGTPTINITGTGVSPTGSAPTDLALAPGSIAEGAPSGSTVGTLTTTDADVGNTFVYTFVGGTGSADNAAFTINGAMVQTNGVFDFETKSAYAVRIRVTDSGGNIFEKALTISVTNVDEAPVAVDDTATVTEDDPATAIDVLANDTDIDGGPKTITSVTQPVNGTVVITGGGSGLTYAPHANYAGPDPFTYTLNGGALGKVAVTVTAVDDAPVAVADAFTIPEDNGATALDVLANDTDVDAGPISITAVTQPAHGTLAITGGGTGVSYTAAANYTGSDSFTYTLTPGGSTAAVTLTIPSVDDPPVAVNDTAPTLEDAGPGFLDVLANDTDVDGGPKMLASFTQPAHGTVTAFQTGVTYKPTANYNGTDTFTYTLNGGSTGTVTMTVLPVNDVPVFTKGADETVLEDSGVHTVATWATMIGKGPADESGQVVDFLVTNTNNPMFAVQPAVSPSGALTYTLAANANGTATVSVRIHDNGGTANGGIDTSAAQTFAITVTPINDAPSFTAGANQTVAEDAGAQSVASFITVFSTGPANESAQTVDYQITNVANGSLFSAAPAVSAAGTLTFTPTANANGTSTVTIRIHDSGGTANGGVDTSAAQTFTITVTAVNDAPSFVVGAAQLVGEDAGPQTVTGFATAISAGPADESGQTLNFIVSNTNTALFLTQPAISPTGTLTYRPDDNGNGTATVTVRLHDNGGGADTSAPQTFTITVSAVDDPPTAANDSATVLEDSGANTLDVRANDPDADLGPKTIIAKTNGANGTVAITNGGSNLTYAPNANYCNNASPVDTFTYTLNGGSSATVSVTVTCANDAPVAVDDTFTLAEDATSTLPRTGAGGPAANDTDVDNATLTVTAVTNAVGGTVSLGASTLSFVPAANLCGVGAGSYDYTISDGALTDVGHVTFNITCVDDAPVPVNDTATILPNAAATAINVLANDTDVDGGTKLVATAADPANGTVVITGGGTGLTYAPDFGYCNTQAGGTPDTFTYSLTPAGGGTATVSVTVPCSADLSIVMSDSPDPVSESAALAYTISLSNLGPTTSYGITVSVALPVGTIYGGFSGANWTCVAGMPVQCSLTSLAFNTAANPLVLSVTAPSTPGNVTAIAGVTSLTADPVSANNSSTTLTFVKLNQSISFTSTPPTTGVFNTTYNVTATASSGLTVSFGTADATKCTIAAGVVTFKSGTGQCVITANQGGNGSYNAAAQQTQTITLGKATPTVTFTSTAPTNPVVFTTYTASATSTSTGAVTFGTSANCSVAGSVVTFTNAGPCTVTASVATDANYLAGSASQSITVAKANQTTTFGAAPSGAYQATGTVSATASSGLTVTFSLNAGSHGCTLAGNQVTITAGSGLPCLVDANQIGNGNYNAAPAVTQTIALVKASQSITVTSPTPTNPVPGDFYTPEATASSGLSVMVGASGACVFTQGLVMFMSSGTCSVTYDQSGDSNYAAALQVTETITVGAGNLCANVFCSPSNNACMSNTCNPSTGVCEENADDSLPCDDGDACTHTDQCSGGQCQGTDPQNCDPPEQCYTGGQCNSGTGQCEYGFAGSGTSCGSGSGTFCDGQGNCNGP